MAATVWRSILGTVSVGTLALAMAWPAAADGVCTAVLGGEWHTSSDTCTAFVESQRKAVMALTVSVPRDLVDHPATGPTVRGYLRERAESWRTMGQEMARASKASIDFRTYSNGRLRSVVFHEFQQTVGNMANNGYRTFTFDLGSGQRLELADLFKPGVDPLSALPPLARPYLDEPLGRAQPPHMPGSYPFTVDRFEPQPDGSGFAGDYRAFAVTADELILYLPDRPMPHESPWPQDRLVWSMDGGIVNARIPLPALTSILRQNLLG